MDFLTTLGDKIYAALIREQRYKYILEGFGNTVMITIAAGALGVLIALCVAIVKVNAMEKGKKTIGSRFCDLYLTVIRGTPAIAQVTILYYIVFSSVRDMPKILVAILAFAINSGAYTAEIIRSGIMSVDRGQNEAGRCLGLSYFDTMRLVILPQAIKNILPAMFNELITLFKETSVLGMIGFLDLMRAGDLIRAATYDAFVPLLLVAGIYLIVVIGLTKVMQRIEGRLRRSDKR